MKIQAANVANINAYKRQLQHQTEQKETAEATDKIDISSAAKKLQEMKQVSTSRAEQVQQIKEAVQSGEYEMNLARTSEKMIDFWSRHT